MQFDGVQARQMNTSAQHTYFLCSYLYQLVWYIVDWWLIDVAEWQRWWRVVQCLCAYQPSIYWRYIFGQLRRNHQTQPLCPRRHRSVSKASLYLSVSSFFQKCQHAIIDEITNTVKLLDQPFKPKIILINLSRWSSSFISPCGGQTGGLNYLLKKKVLHYRNWVTFFVE